MMVEYHVGPVIRMIYDDSSLLDSKAFNLLHPEVAIALGDCLKQVQQIQEAKAHVQTFLLQVIRPNKLVEELVASRIQGQGHRVLGPGPSVGS